MDATRTTSTMERREFLRALATRGLVLAVWASGCRRVADALAGEVSDASEPFAPAAYLRIDEDGIVTVICHRTEMGQGVRSSFAMVVADELEAEWSRVRLEQAPGDEKTYGSQDTDGSRSVREFLPALRLAGATARTMLETAAAQQWKVSVGEIQARLGSVVHTPTGRTASYGALVPIARLLPVPQPASITLKTPASFRYIGKEMRGLDTPDLVTGRATFGIDVRREGMRIAVIARPPVYGSHVASVDFAAAERVVGVERVVTLDGGPPPPLFQPLGGVAVIARNTWAALQGRRKLKITWTDSPNDGYDSAAYRALIERGTRQPGTVARTQGDVDAALASSQKRVTADYYLPHLAHAAMEPLAALAVVEGGRCEIWAPTQNPQGARETVAMALKIPVDNVTVHVTLLGGGFGRKSKADFIAEAALLAREVGAPVKVIWSREDDIRHDYYHAPAAEHMEAGLDANGHVTAWLHRSALPSIGSTFATNVTRQADFELGMGATDLPYPIPNLRVESAPAAAHTRIGWYRSVAHISHAFAVCSFIDELAHAAGTELKAFIGMTLGADHVMDMRNVGLTAKQPAGGAPDEYAFDTSRLRRVLEVASAESRWGSQLPAGHGRGLALHRSFLTYVATIVHVAVGPDGALTIPRVDVAMDAGLIVNPDRVRSQVEGATIMGLGNALHGEITFKDGSPVQSNFSDYRVARMPDAPRELHVHLVASDAPSSGVGEPGVPPAAPALCNAIFAATGRRIRSLPIGTQLSAAAG